MKMFTILKTGYSSGYYGCSAEYFTCIFTHKGSLKCFRFYGMYGAEERVGALMVKKGYKGFYTSAEWGKVPAREAQKYSNSEHIIIQNIDELLKNGYINFDK